MSRSEHSDQVAAELRAAIARRQMKLSELSDLTEIPKSTLSRKLNGTRSPLSVEELVSIAAALDVSLASIFISIEAAA